MSYARFPVGYALSRLIIEESGALNNIWESPFILLSTDHHVIFQFSDNHHTVVSCVVVTISKFTSQSTPGGTQIDLLQRARYSFYCCV